jgi:peptide/nickel transport system substrate-binding protein
VSRRRNAPVRIVMVALAIALIAAACGSSSKKSNEPNATAAHAPKGSVVFGAEQWPDCINPITQCANSSWLQWLVPIHVLPRLMELDEHAQFVASPLLTEAPTTDNGGLKTNADGTFDVTYHLNPDAEWQPDGTPITSDDVKFSWRAVIDSKGSVTTTGYDKITDISTPDPQTAVLHFKQVYTDWPDVLGGFSGVILEKAKFPKGTDTGAEMATSIGFSGGPWILQSFNKQQEILVANDKYWDKDRIPRIQQVTFIPLTETNQEVQGLKTGTVSAIYPQPATDNVPQLKGDAALKTAFGVTTQYENFWFNEKPGKPFEDKNVRAAFSYAVDRELLLNDIVKPFNPDVQMLQCAAWIPQVGKWCTNTDWQDVKPDPAKVAQFMQASGYAKDASGIWAKGGKQLVLKWMVNTGNKRREDTQAEFIPLLAKQGFKVVTDNSDADTVFQKRLPAGDYDFSMFIQVTSSDPTVTSILSCGEIPGPSNKGQGQNDWWYCNKQADQLMEQSDKELDTTKREDQIHQIDQILRQDYVNLPLYAFPAMSAWRPDKIKGPIDQFINSPESNFWNMWAWDLA